MSNPPIEIKNIDLDFQKENPKVMKKKAADFFELMSRRRTVRDFSDEAIPEGIIEHCISAAGTAPSGANRQPWHFAVVGNPATKRQIRLGAEEEEREFYSSRAPKDWLEALAPLGTDANKPFLETAPYLIVIFAEKFAKDQNNQKTKNYYVPESVGIASGLLIAALHNAGLATLTHTPAPMKFLNEILERPNTEKPMMILVVGYPKANAKVPAIARKELLDIASFHI